MRGTNKSIRGMCAQEFDVNSQGYTVLEVTHRLHTTADDNMADTEISPNVIVIVTVMIW